MIALPCLSLQHAWWCVNWIEAPDTFCDIVSFTNFIIPKILLGSCLYIVPTHPRLQLACWGKIRQACHQGETLPAISFHLGRMFPRPRNHQLEMDAVDHSHSLGQDSDQFWDITAWLVRLHLRCKSLFVGAVFVSERQVCHIISYWEVCVCDTRGLIAFCRTGYFYRAFDCHDGRYGIWQGDLVQLWRDAWRRHVRRTPS